MTTDRLVHRLASDQLTTAQVDELRSLVWDAFASDDSGSFTEDDWKHAIGGTHVIAQVDGRIVCHAAVVERRLHVDGVGLKTGYVEAVATSVDHRSAGHGTAVMRVVNELVTTDYELGALGTGKQSFYERLGWRVWHGSSFVRMETGDERTPDEDGYIMVLPTPATPSLRADAPIVCEWRPGDVW